MFYECINCGGIDSAVQFTACQSCLKRMAPKPASGTLQVKVWRDRVTFTYLNYYRTYSLNSGEMVDSSQRIMPKSLQPKISDRLSQMMIDYQQSMAS